VYHEGDILPCQPQEWDKGSHYIMMRYTRMTDNNGAEVFVEDIINAYGELYIVKYIDGDYYAVNDSKKLLLSSFISFSGLLGNLGCIYPIVAGNKYEQAKPLPIILNHIKFEALCII